MPSRTVLWVAAGAILAIAYLGSDLLDLLVDYLWFDAQAYLQVFRTILTTKIVLVLLTGVAAAGFLFANLWYVLRNLSDLEAFLSPDFMASPLGMLLSKRFAMSTALGLSLIGGLMTGMTVSGAWHSVLLYLNGGSFDQVDPIFGEDVGFYVFTLPFLDQVHAFLWSLGLLGLGATGLLYFLKAQADAVQRGGTFDLNDLPRSALLHVAGLGALLLLVMAWGYYLERFGLMHTPGGLFAGPGYSDIYGTLPVLTLKILVAVLAASALVYGLLKRQLKLLIGAAAVVAVVSVGGGIYASILQRLVVNPNELEKERPYLQHHIAATNRAFALDKLEERSLTEDTELTLADIGANQATIQNIRLWDHEPLLDTFSQIQEIRTYYDFLSVDNDRYRINGELRQTMLSPRELNTASLPSRTWVNERLTFTHGYGVALGPVNRVDQQGLPVLFVKDLPPRTEIPELDVTRPEIYYGEVPSEHVFVKTRQQEFDYPEGDKNIFNVYQGDGGLGLGGMFRRLLFATYFRDVKILLAEDFTADTRVLLFRNVAERVRKIAPFFLFDRDPYMVIDQGRLVWIFDAYTASDRYPYAESVPELGKNYMRNPVKVIVDAYNGSVTMYLIDEQDPIAAAYARIFPGLLRPMSDLSEELRAHLRHPFDYFNVQAFMYATYHMLDVNTFYNKEDQWEVPVVGDKPMEPYLTVMKLPGEEKEEFILMLPFTPRLKDNMAAWMVARADGENYGRLVAYTFPKQKLIFGPKQMMARINQNAEVSQQITLWDQSGSNVIRGTLLVIPIESSLLYIQPIYLKADEGRIPELKRVVVGYQNEIAMGTDLDDAIAQIFGSDSPLGAGESAPDDAGRPAHRVPVVGDAPASRAMAHYERMLRASQEGDWARFGEELDALGVQLRQLTSPAE